MKSFPSSERLQKLLARAGIGSRREIERWIVAGEISVNGQKATLGMHASSQDRIKLRGRLLSLPSTRKITPRVLIYNKPEGEVCARRDPQNRPTVFRNLPTGRWIGVGRLDINTQGLLLFTNDGRLAHQLMHPATGVKREYAVRLRGELDESQMRRLLEGVRLEDGPARFEAIKAARQGEGINQWYHVILREGRQREVRRLMEAVGLPVSRLIRVRYGNVELPRGLRSGKWRALDEPALQALYALAGLEYAAPSATQNHRRQTRVHRRRPR